MTAEKKLLDTLGALWLSWDMTHGEHPWYSKTAGCELLPDLLRGDTDAPEFLWPDGEPESIIRAVAARQAGGGRLQEKIDGCWCEMTVDSEGCLTEPRSRSDRYLRYACDWEGQPVGSRFAGWTVIGEVEAGTTAAKRRREAREKKGYYGIPLFHVYALVAPDGTLYDGPEIAQLVGQMNSIETHGRLRVVPEALPGEDWGAFTRRVLEAGGEGVIIRQNGKIWRAKTLVTLDRYVLGVATEKARNGRYHHQARIGVCISAGERPRYKELQRVEVPSGIRPNQISKRVVAVTGSMVMRETGVIRHARIVEVRPPEEKQGTECWL